MTPLEIVLTIFAWVATGLWVCHKRDWYRDYNDNTTICVFATVFAPANLAIVFVKVFCVDRWDNRSSY